MFELMDTTSDRAILSVINLSTHNKKTIEWMMENDEAEGLNFIGGDLGLLNVNDETGMSTRAKGRELAIEISEKIIDVIQPSDMLMIIVNLNEPYELGIAEIVSEIASLMEILTVAIGITYYPLVEVKEHKIKDSSIKVIKEFVNSLIMISADLSQNQTHLDTPPSCRNNSVVKAILGVTEMIYLPGLIRVDFADVRTIMSERGEARMGYGCAQGKNRAKDAAKQAISQLISGDIKLISEASGILVTVRVGMNVSINDFEEVGNAIKEYASENSILVVAVPIVPELIEELQVIIIATGLGEENMKRKVEDSANDKSSIIENAVKEKLISRNDLISDDSESEYLDIPAFLHSENDSNR